MSSAFSFQIDWKHLAALSLLASRDATRYILNGVFVQACPTGAPYVLMVATDGRRMGVYRAAVPEPMPAGEGVIIPLSLVSASRPKGKTEIVIEVEPANKRRRVTIRPLGGGKSVSDFASDGNYPNWRHVMPTREMVPAPQVAIQLGFAADFAAIAQAFGGKHGTGAYLRSHADPANPSSVIHSVILMNHPEFIGVLMPVRCDTDRPVPEWAKVIPAPKPAEPTPAPAPAAESAPVPATT